MTRAEVYLAAVRQFIKRFRIPAKSRADWESWLESLPEQDWELHVAETERILRARETYWRDAWAAWNMERPTVTKYIDSPWVRIYRNASGERDAARNAFCAKRIARYLVTVPATPTSPVESRKATAKAKGRSKALKAANRGLDPLRWPSLTAFDTEMGAL